MELKSFLLQCRSLLVALPRGLERAAGPISPLVPFVGCQGFGGGPLLWSLQPRLSGTHTSQLLGRRGFAFVQLRGALQPAGCQLSSLWPIRGPGQEREGSSSCSSYAFEGEKRSTGPLIPHPFVIHPSIHPSRLGQVRSLLWALSLLFPSSKLHLPCLSNGAASTLAYVGTTEDKCINVGPGRMPNCIWESWVSPLALHGSTPYQHQGMTPDHQSRSSL